MNHDDSPTGSSTDDRSQGAGAPRANGSSALRRSTSDETQHIPLVSGTDQEPEVLADSGLTLGERLAREAEARRHGEAPSLPAQDRSFNPDDPNPPTGFVGAGPIRTAVEPPAGEAEGMTAVHPHVGSRGDHPASDLSDEPPTRAQAVIGSLRSAESAGPARGAASVSAGGSSAAPREPRNTDYDDEAPRGLSAIQDPGTRPDPAFLNGFDDDEVGDYVPGQWDEPAEKSPLRETHTASPATSSLPVIPSTPDNTRAVPVAGRQETPTTGLAGAAAVAADEDRIAAERRKDEDTPFLRRTEDDQLPAPRRDPAEAEYANRLELLEREKAEFGGIRLGTGFFGWMTAMGMLSLLTSMVLAILGGIAYMNSATTTDITRELQALTNGGAGTSPNAVIAACIGGAILAVSFLSGGYVAGRMARFSGALQGLGTWLWFLAAAAVMTLIGVFGLGTNAVPSGSSLSKWLPSAAELTSPSALMGLGAVLLISLLFALLGGALGMRYHRTIDRYDYDAAYDED